MGQGRMSFEPRQDGAQAAPVTWLASFPRSGNTLLRVVLKTCFRISSASIYGDSEFPDPATAQMVGAQAVGPDVQAFIRNARAQGRRLFVKTHELPGADTHPAIHMVRDGRAALVSRWHYQREILGRPRALRDIIAEAGAGSWSGHVAAWMTRPGTLTLRYEKLAAGDAATLAAIADFTGRPQAAPFDIRFAHLNAMDPAFFRAGNDAANIAEMDAEDRALFERLHGETLRALGYA
jgi:sulfotransferase family protein